MHTLSTVGFVILYTVIYLVMLVFGIVVIGFVKRRIIAAFKSVFKI